MECKSYDVHLFVSLKCNLIIELQIYRVEHLYIHGCALLNGHRDESYSNELVGIKAKTNHFTCEKEHPEEFVRISAYIDWIENNVWLSNSGVTGANYLTFSTYIILLLQLIYILN